MPDPATRRPGPGRVVVAGSSGLVGSALVDSLRADDLGFALAVRMNRPFLLRAPVWGMNLVLGRDATEAILTADMDVAPAVLEASGFVFRHATVEDAVAAAVPAAG